MKSAAALPPSTNPFGSANAPMAPAPAVSRMTAPNSPFETGGGVNQTVATLARTSDPQPRWGDPRQNGGTGQQPQMGPGALATMLRNGGF